MPLWYIDYFEREVLEKQHMQEGTFSELPLIWLKADLPKGTRLS